MNTSNAKKIVVCGTGSIGMRHLRILRQIPGCLPMAMPKRLQRGEILKEEGYAVAADFSQAVAMGARLGIIATDTGRHLSDSLSALEQGLDLLVEKPAASDAESGEAILRKAKEKKKNVFVGCVLRFNESLIRFREWLPKIGNVHSARIECQSYLPDWRPDRDFRESYSARAGEGGVLRDLIHEIDTAGSIFGWPRKISARLKNFGILKIEAEEAADLWWTTEAGTQLSMTLDYLSRVPRRKMEAFGAEGNLEWDGLENRVILRLPKKEPEIFASGQTRDEMFLEQARAFLAFFNEPSLGAGGPLATLEEGILALKICDKARIHPGLSGERIFESP